MFNLKKEERTLGAPNFKTKSKFRRVDKCEEPKKSTRF